MTRRSVERKSQHERAFERSRHVSPLRCCSGLLCFLAGNTRMKRSQLKRRSGIKRTPFPRNTERVPGTSRKARRVYGLKSKGDSPAMTKVKAQARERDNYTCQYPGCGYFNKHIDVHHICKRSQRPDLKVTLSNLVCLCRKHHQFTDTNRREAEALGLVGGETYEKARKAA
jgi:5-methylcytosine-specific restriction endonuclease McrA